MTGWFIFIAFIALLGDDPGVAVVFGILALFSSLGDKND